MSMDDLNRINEQLSRAFSSTRTLEMPEEFRTRFTFPPVSPALRGYMEFHR